MHASTGSDLLFVYGTLRRRSGHRMVDVLERAADFVGAAFLQARLYMVASYPGAVLSDDPADRVRGDVFRLRDADHTLHRIDQYEGCKPGDTDAPYVRSLNTVILEAAGDVTAWAYVYTRPTAALERIRSGDFLKHRRGRRE